MVSEALQGEGAVPVDLSGLHNVSKVSSERSPADDVTKEAPSELAVEPETVVEEQEMIFADALSLNSVTTDG